MTLISSITEVSPDRNRFFAMILRSAMSQHKSIVRNH